MKERNSPADKNRSEKESETFRLIATDAGARRGVLRLAHGDVQTPVFMPVGTQAAVKTLSSEDVESLGYEIILANTYHVFLRPGIDLLEAAGGIHRFMSWNRGILTDSGGYQVFSLSGRRQISEEGVTFSSHVDGSRHLLTPENVTRAQIRIGVDVAMCLDECPPYPVTEAMAREMMERTLRWAERCKREWMKDPVPPSRALPGGKRAGPSDRTLLFPIVQGSTYPDLRRESARRTVEFDLPGYAVGGLSVGEPREILGEMVEASVSELPKDRPRYLMGVGKPPDIIEAVERGIDMMDCVLPTRNGRNGQALTWDGPVNLFNNRFRNAADPIDPDCPCLACRRYDKRYIAHLFRSGEYLALRLLSLHNLAFMVEFMRQIRESIESSKFAVFKKRFLQRYQPTE
jgi:queuine tRNA-ribosyltransferase